MKRSRAVEILSAFVYAVTDKTVRLSDQQASDTLYLLEQAGLVVPPPRFDEKKSKTEIVYSSTWEAENDSSG